MRLLKVERHMPEADIKRFARNCIAVPDIKVAAQKKTYGQKKALERAELAPSTFTCRNDKLSRNIRLTDVAGIIAKEAKDFYRYVNKRLFYTSCTGLTALLLALVFHANFSFGYSAMLGEVKLGVVAAKADAYAAIDRVNEEIAPFVSGMDIITDTPVLLPAIVRKNAYTPADRLAEGIKSTSAVMTQAYAVKVNDYTVAALDSQEAADAAISTYLAQFVPEGEDIAYRFDGMVQVHYSYVPLTLMRSVEETVAALGSSRAEVRVAELSPGDTIPAILEYYGMTEEDFRALNPEIGDTLDGLTTVLVDRNVPVLAVVTDQKVQFEDAIPYETERVDDPDLYQGTERVEIAGVAGTKAVTEAVSKVNGQVTDTQVLEEVVLTQPVTQVVHVGTKPRPSNMGTGSFIRPYYGTISSRFGWRSRGNHTGVDFCGSTGDPVVASDNGTVEFAGWSGGYGKLVKIDHNNGYVTYYAHNSQLLVSAGETVAKGDVIARLGSTGNSTGPHCHFEIRKNGDVVNPMNYVN